MALINSISVGTGALHAKLKGLDVPHRLDGVGEDDFLVGFSLLLVIPAMVYKLHLLEHRRLLGDNGGP